MPSLARCACVAQVVSANDCSCEAELLAQVTYQLHHTEEKQSSHMSMKTAHTVVPAGHLGAAMSVTTYKKHAMPPVYCS